MARKINWSLSLILLVILSLLSTVNCDEKDDVYVGINSYRSSRNLPQLSRNKKASCVADEIAEKVQDEPCPNNTGVASPIRAQDYSGVLDKCGVDVNHTSGGVILPVCVRKLVSTLVLTNYTHTQNAKYLNDSKFTGAGLGSEDDWMVLVLTTDAPLGTFSGVVKGFGLHYCMLAFLVGTVVFMTFM